MATRAPERRSSPGTARVPRKHRRVVAMWVQLIAGYFAVTPLVAELLGEDPLAPDTIERQTQFLRKLARLVAGSRDLRSTTP